MLCCVLNLTVSYCSVTVSVNKSFDISSYSRVSLFTNTRVYIKIGQTKKFTYNLRKFVFSKKTSIVTECPFL